MARLRIGPFEKLGEACGLLLAEIITQEWANHAKNMGSLHWLTWHEIGEFLRTWQGLAVAIVGILGVIYYGPRKMLETWDWYLHRFLDEPVLRILREEAMLLPEFRDSPVQGLSVRQLSAKLKRSDRSIGKSIERLRRSAKIEYYRGGFRLKE